MDPGWEDWHVMFMSPGDIMGELCSRLGNISGVASVIRLLMVCRLMVPVVMVPLSSATLTMSG